MSKYLLYKPLKCQRRIYIFGRVIEDSLGGYFLFAHSVYTRGVPKVTELARLRRTTAAKIMKHSTNIRGYFVI